MHFNPIDLIVVFLAAAIIGVMLFRRAGLSAVLGYLVAGIVIGPSGVGFFDEPATLASIAEIGVVMFLFIIGLELKFDTLMGMRRDIGVVGGGQMLVTTAAFALAAWSFGLPVTAALAVGFALALSATSIALQLLNERGELQAPHGQKTFTVLIFQDIATVPALALLPLLGSSGAEPRSAMEVLQAIGIGLGALAVIVIAGRYLLNPLFKLLAETGAHEVMTASALFIVLGAASLMHLAGMSMALGAFLAGILLAESNFRHELEADIEPFRGLLLGLFFMSVGMLIDLRFVWEQIGALIGVTVLMLIGKFAIAYVIAMLDRAKPMDRLRFAALLTPSGEFAFVLLPLATGIGLVDATTGKFLTAAAAMTMFVGPVLARAVDMIAARQPTTDLVAAPDAIDADLFQARGSAIVIGGGRFGQLVNQMLLAARTDVTVIDNDIEMIQAAGRFGFKIYFGDGSRLDVLRAAGAENARIIAVCIDNKEAAVRIAEICRLTFPLAKVFVRAYDRRHALELMDHEPEFIVRETFESALAFGKAALKGLGLEDEFATDVQAEIRKRDEQRLIMQKADGLMAGIHLNYRAGVQPEPLVAPTAKSKALSAETQEALEAADDNADAARQGN
jgi:glutathione-regulated potassium-efflux system protein KefB